MKTLLRIIGTFLLVGTTAPAIASDVPLGAPAATFGPGTLDVLVAGTGLATQPATFSVTVPDGGTVLAAYLYVTGRGAGDGDVVLNGSPTALPLVAASGPLPFDPSQTIETRRLDVTDGVGPGVTTFTIDGYEQVTPGGAFVVVVVSHPLSPVRTVSILEGADYAYHGFASPFGPHTTVGSFAFEPSTGSRVAHVFFVTHDTEAARADAIWALAADSSATPVPASLVGGANGSSLLEIDLLGVPASAGGFAVGGELDIVSRDHAVPAGADYLAFQVESPTEGNGDSLALSVAVLVLPDGAGSGGGPGGGGPGDGGPGDGGPGECGDRTVDEGEACDDGNLVDGDGCSATCTEESQARTIDAIFRVRKHRRDRLWYFTQLPDLPSDLVGTTPVHVTMVANGLALLDFEVPAKAFQRIEPRATNAVPGGKFASTRGRMGDLRLQYLRLWPLGQKAAYNLKLKVRREMLRRSGGISSLTSIVRIGDRTYSSTDHMVVRRRGRILRNMTH